MGLRFAFTVGETEEKHEGRILDGDLMRINRQLREDGMSPSDITLVEYYALVTHRAATRLGLTTIQDAYDWGDTVDVNVESDAEDEKDAEGEATATPAK